MAEEAAKASYNPKNGVYKCVACVAGFAPKRTLNQPQNKCHYEENLQCDICDLYVNSSMALMVHKKLHCWEKDVNEKQLFSPVYECSECDHITRSPRNLVFHYQEIHPSIKRLSYTKTHKKKSLPRVLYDENQNEMSLVDFGCDLLENKVKCPFCNVYYAENRMKGHLMTLHPFDKNLFCTYCAAIIQDEQEMQKHLLGHTQGGKLFTCNICDSFLISAEALAQHRRLHTGQRPFPCSVCQKEFQSKTGAIAHFHSHLKIEMLRDTCDTAQNVLLLQKDNQNVQVVSDSSEHFINVWD